MSVPMVEVTSRGVITIPKSVRDNNEFCEGQKLVCIDLGGGVIVLSKRPSRIDEMVDELRDSLLAKGATLESMLRQLREMREKEDA